MYGNILVPVVFDDGHDNHAAFEIARALAREGAEFTVLHVMDAIPGYVRSQIPDEVLAAAHKEVESDLRKAARAVPNSHDVLRTGRPGRVIVDFAQERRIDCIVMASHTPGLENLLIGSTADFVVKHAKCAVHVIR